jgi:hypothetical protein
MMPGFLRSTVSAVTTAAMGLATGCTTTRQLDHADWGALHGNEQIVVVTRNGVRHELNEFEFFTTGLVGRGDQGDVQISLDSVAVVEVQERNTAAPIIFTALAAGTVFAVLIAHQESPVEPTSCPFVYSFDGEEYRFDSETFAGAVARGLDRTDFDNLEHMRPVDGRYRLRLVNSRPETQYTDELNLIAVDHVPGTQAIPDRTGKVHIIAKPRAPQAARGVHGEEALTAVRHADDFYWSGAPLEAIDSDEPEEFRDGLVVTFARPPGVQSATLVVRARNTALAPFAFAEFLQLQGEGLFNWYLRVEQDESLRKRIRDWVAREGTLHVSLWREGRWTLQDALVDVGPAISKSQVARLNLDGVDADTFAVRLESARGLWQIDWVAMDVEPETPVKVTELEPRWAQDEGGRDVRELLVSEDGRYYASVEGGMAEIEFDVPDFPSDDRVQSVILKSRGFYYIHLPHDGPNQAPLADRILDEPLVGNRYIVERWQAKQR